MLPDIVEAHPIEPYRIYVRFEDGVEGAIDLERAVPFQGVFAPLRNHEEFRRLAVDPELGTVTWPCGADLDPLVLHGLLTGAPRV